MWNIIFHIFDDKEAVFSLINSENNADISIP